MYFIYLHIYISIYISIFIYLPYLSTYLSLHIYIYLVCFAQHTIYGLVLPEIIVFSQLENIFRLKLYLIALQSFL